MIGAIGLLGAVAVIGMGVFFSFTAGALYEDKEYGPMRFSLLVAAVLLALGVLMVRAA